MSKERTGALIIRNLRLFEAASKLFDAELETGIFKAVDKLTEEWAVKAKWRGKFDFVEDTIWVAPPHWVPEGEPTKGVRKKVGKEEPHAHFEMWGGEGDTLGGEASEDYWWLSRLCGVGSGELGFRWELDEGEFGIRGKKAKWKTFIRERAPAFVEKGFKFESEQGRFFLPVRVDPSRLAQAYESGSVEDALEPLTQALTRIEEVTPNFDKLLTEIRKEFRG
jgi:hypothetical protein